MAFSLGKRRLLNCVSGGAKVRVAGRDLASQARNGVSCKKNHDPGGEQTWIWTERARRKKIDKQ